MNKQSRLMMLLLLLPQLLNAQRFYTRQYLIGVKAGLSIPADLENQYNNAADRTGGPFMAIYLDKPLCGYAALRFEANASYFGFRNEGAVDRSYYLIHGNVLVMGFTTNLAFRANKVSGYIGFRGQVLPCYSVIVDKLSNIDPTQKSKPKLNRISASVAVGIEITIWDNLGTFVEVSPGLFQIQKDYRQEVRFSLKTMSLSSVNLGLKVPLKTIKRRGTYQLDMPL